MYDNWFVAETIRLVNEAQPWLQFLLNYLAVRRDQRLTIDFSYHSYFQKQTLHRECYLPRNLGHRHCLSLQRQNRSRTKVNPIPSHRFYFRIADLQYFDRHSFFV